MNETGQNLIEEVVQELFCNFSDDLIKGYLNAAKRSLRLCRAHGPYQAAAHLTIEVRSAAENDPRNLLHEHIIKALDKDDVSLAGALSEEEDPMKCLDNISRMLRFLERISAELAQGGIA